ncbi:biopolymer transporter ExbD [Candidatus Albibeggiatoa sp. nov. NOAA]|uniref:ExbD/TolR family protein n=1 Tax=Candidatus Albibeggiatoa sp. nov. NOAA TaxID=3162724 RepID=UPI0032FB80DE|nr:biopolymer transporter ExbD [Thiotrichaceae bacterium]
MAFSNFDEGAGEEVSDINMIPLIDVMLVLLILFIITAPLFTPHAFQIDVPEAETTATTEQPDTIALAIDEQGQLFWGDDSIDNAELSRRLTEAAKQKPQPPVHLRADKQTRYEQIAGIMEAVQESGIGQLGFVTKP